MRHRQGIVAGDLQQEVAVREVRAQPIHTERGEGREPCGGRTSRSPDEARADAERDREARRRRGEFRLGVGEGGEPLREARRVVGQESHESGEGISVDIVVEVQADEDAVGLGSGVDTGLMGAEERHGLVSVHRHGCGFRRGVRSIQGEVRSDGRDRADTGDSSSEEELPPGRPGAGGAGALNGRRHQ